MEHLLLPRTDAAVLAQAVVVTVAMAAIAWRVRRDRDLLRLAAGVWVFVAGLFVLRAMH